MSIAPPQVTTDAEIEIAKCQISAAVTALEGALRSIDTAPRPEKIAVSDAVERALERLNAARAALSALRLESPSDDE